MARRRFRLGPALVALGLAVALFPLVWPGDAGPVRAAASALVEAVEDRVRARLRARSADPAPAPPPSAGETSADATPTTVVPTTAVSAPISEAIPVAAERAKDQNVPEEGTLDQPRR